MRDTELYQQILGLAEPWSVARVDLNVKEQRVDVYAEHGIKTKWSCPECGKESGSTITTRSGRGGTSTAASSRRSSTRASRAFAATSTV